MSPAVATQSAPHAAEQQPTKAVVPTKRAGTLPRSGGGAVEGKKMSQRAGKPIINWFQRKLAGGSSFVKPKRAENQLPPGQGRPTSIPLRTSNRISSAPPPNKQTSKSDIARRKTISLNEEEDGELYANDLASEISSPVEADEDASMRPLPPSVPPSPSPSSASYVSDPRTFRSLAASTKPTTLLSIDLNGNGMAHIAQAPAPIARLHVRSSSTATSGPAGVSFSALPPASDNAALRILNQHSNSAVPPVQAPLHTTHHPRNNPRPSSPPLDNASVLTLASSAYAIPSRTGVNTPGWSSAPPSALGDSISMSHFNGSIIYPDAESTSHYLLGDDDVDASVRALRPRSSRRGSWESEASRWSARVQQGGSAAAPSLARDGRSLWTSNSIRTGGMSAENDMDEKSDAESQVDATSLEGDRVAEQTPKIPHQVAADALHIPLPDSADDDLLAVPSEDATPVEEVHEDAMTPNERVPA